MESSLNESIDSSIDILNARNHQLLYFVSEEKTGSTLDKNQKEYVLQNLCKACRPNPNMAGINKSDVIQ